ncbi:MAG: ATP-binding cassette domain-containing protein [Spirochaetia bacterium]|nr:ATP-binding cassette domain-containing protein [Spirochaetia bacterium]
MDVVNRLDVNIEQFTYDDGTCALKQIILKLESGEFAGILGANGSGKTTLLKVMDGLVKQFHGVVLLDGKDIKKLTPKEIFHKVGLVFQNPDDQLFGANVFEDVAFGPRNMGFKEHEVLLRVNEALAEVDMAESGNRPIHYLSYGQKKRICIAGLLAMGHEILLLDEPTSGLDPAGEFHMMELLKKINREKKVSILMATHNVDIVPVFLDKIYILNNGGMFLSGTPQEIFMNPENMEQIKLRLPCIAELFYRLENENGFSFQRLPLTVSEGQEEILRQLKHEQ